MRAAEALIRFSYVQAKLNVQMSHISRQISKLSFKTVAESVWPIPDVDGCYYDYCRFLR